MVALFKNSGMIDGCQKISFCNWKRLEAKNFEGERETKCKV